MTLFSSSRAASSAASVLDDSEKLAWLRLIRTDNIGPITFYSLLETYGSARKAIESLPELARRGGRLKNLHIATAESVLAEMERLHALGGEFIFATEKDYPLALAATEDAPPVLAVLGNKRLLNLPSIAMVGARNASLNGRKFAEKLSRELGAAGQIITSGLARGIDTAAHQGALATGTTAVVAGGIDIVYPPENQPLYKDIIHEGCIIAESPLGMEPIARHFPRRNRIVSGLSAAVIVVEATLKSGSLITARLAAEQGRDVYAVPGHPYDPRAAGPNKLLQDGAGLVVSAQDILQQLGQFSGTGINSRHLYEPSHTAFEEAVPAAPPDEKTTEEVRTVILQNLSSLPVTVDELVRNCHLTIPSVQIVLLELELAGRLQRLPGNRVTLIN